MVNHSQNQNSPQPPEKLVAPTLSHPYLRAAGDGTYELLVPLGRGFVHILPYCFHTEKEAAIWLATRKGRELIHLVRQKINNESASAVIIPSKMAV